MEDFDNLKKQKERILRRERRKLLPPELLALLGQATKTPWAADNGDSALWGVFQSEDSDGIAYCAEPALDGYALLRTTEAEANAKLIVAAVNWIAELAKEKKE